jgi:hypothetical protein
MWLWKNKFLVSLIFIWFVSRSIAFGQREIDPEENPSFKDRMYFGGNLGLQFGTVTLIDVSPLAGVMITPKFSSGIGATYQYYDDNRFQGSAGSSYGGRFFTRYNVL